MGAKCPSSGRSLSRSQLIGPKKSNRENMLGSTEVKLTGEVAKSESDRGWLDGPIEILLLQVSGTKSCNT